MSDQITSTVQTSKPSILGREPVMWMALIQAGIALAVGFGFDLTNMQIGLILAFVATVLGFIARSQVTPTETLPEKSTQTVTINASGDREEIVTEALNRLEQASRDGTAPKIG